ncbi:MAG: hypothetical protein QW448_04575 [Thermofilaceae archaeon]
MRYTSSNGARKCEHCGKNTGELYDMNGVYVCSDCIRYIAFYQTIREGLRDPSLREDTFNVGLDIGNIVTYNPISYAWLYPLIIWEFYKTRGWSLLLNELEKGWRYKTPLEKVLQIYLEEEIFKIIEAEDRRKIIMEGNLLAEILKKYGDRSDVLDIACAWISGLIVSRLHKEPDAPSFRAVRTIINCIAEKLIGPDGSIKAEPFVKVVSYRCKRCGSRFPTREEIRRHVIDKHMIPSDEIAAYVEEERNLIGYFLDLESFIDALRKEYVDPEIFFTRIHKFRVLVHNDEEAPRIVERNGKRYLIINPSWVRLVSRAREYERFLIRGREK